MTLTTAHTSTALELQARCGEHVHLPGSSQYEQHRMPWNVAVDQRPVAVCVPETVAHVSQVVRAAAELGLAVAPQATGHGAGPLASHDVGGTVLLRTHLLAGVHVDPVARIARVEAGAQWAHVMEKCLPHGLVALHGSAPDVGVVGYTLGGGLGWYARKHGLAAHSLRAVELVTVTGEVVRADDRQNQELLWACRGGGGNVGIVTTVEIELLDVGTPYAGMLLWELERAPEVLQTWAEWCRTAPEEVTTSFRVMRFPPLPELPPFLSGRSVVVIDGAALLPEEQAVELFAPLRALAPELDTLAAGSPDAVVTMHMDPPAPTPAVGAGAVLAELTEDTVRAFLAAVGPGVETSLFLAELRHIGAALSRPADAALSHVPGSHIAMFISVVATPQARAEGEQVTAAAAGSLEPWATGGSFLNLAERAVDPSRAFTPEAWQRLCDVRRRYDPAGTVLANHPVPVQRG